MQNKIEDIYPLSPMQAGFLFQALYAPQSDAYFVQSILEIDGELDILIFKSAWQEVSARHPILRTGFVWEDGEEPAQYVSLSIKIPFMVLDWRNFKETEREKKLETFLRKDRKKRFNIRKVPLFKFVLIKWSLNTHYLIWTKHHILLDGWSLPILLQEVAIIYQSLKSRTELCLQTPGRYRDYIAWLQKKDVQEAEFFWKQYLDLSSGCTTLTFKKMIEENKSEKYGNYSTSFSRNETDVLRSFAGHHGLTVNTVIQGILGIILQAYLSKPEVFIGITVSGRNIELPGIENMVGLFINTLPLKITYLPEDSLITFLKRIQTDAQNLNDYAYMPLSKIQASLGVKESLFNVLLVFENYPIDAILEKNHIDYQIKTIRGIEETEYPLTIAVTPNLELYFSFSYKTQHFNDGFIKRLFGHVRTVMQNFLQNQENLGFSIKEASLLTRQEQQQLLTAWNNARIFHKEYNTVHKLFEEQVKRTPDKIALIYKDEELTYQELNEKANQLAFHLRSLGVKPQVFVAIAIRRSFELVIGLLAILKAGGTYVPLDPNYPEERFKFMLQDSAASILLSQVELEQQFTCCQISVLTVRLDLKTRDLFIGMVNLSKKFPTTQNPECSGYDLAYLIYTSGTTGLPKGVMVEHKSIFDKLVCLKDLFKLDASDSFVHYTSFSFDAAIEELFLPLIVGAKCFLFQDEGKFNVEVLGKFMVQNSIAIFDCVPAILEHILYYKKDFFRNFKFKRILVGGDTLPANILKKALENSEEVWNLYGPTETTIDATAIKYTHFNNDEAIVSIGRPITNTKVYILDSFLNPVPIGIKGELYVGGVGVARGYLKRPDLTAEKFIPNPFFDKNKDCSLNLRLYRTGDLARYLPGGNIEFLGRIDAQVKIRGFRVELGEIESLLNCHEEVTRAVVLLSQNKELISYVVPKRKTFIREENDTPIIEVLKTYLAAMLPSYMIPARFFFISEIPITYNGKIDRKALPLPELYVRQVSAEHVAPSTVTEETLCHIWREVLRLDQVSVFDDFFKLGGHSLLVTQVISRIRHIYAIDIPLKTLFQYPTIFSLGQIIDSLKKEQKNFSIPRLKPTLEKEERVPLSFAQARLWFLDQLVPNSTLYNIPIGIKIVGQLNIEALEKAINQIIVRHDSLRTVFPTLEGEAFQVVLDEFIIRISENFQDLTLLPEAEKATTLKKIAEMELNIPFNLAKGPLFRLKLLFFSEKEHIFFIVFHHIIADGWSLGIFFKELSYFYNNYIVRKHSELSPLPIQYIDFSLWQKQWLRGEFLNQQLAYWKKQLFGIPDIIDFPTDKVRPAELSYAGARYRGTLSKEIRDQLEELAQYHQASLFMVFLTIFQILLYRYTNQQDIVVGTPVANRNYKELEDLIGFFVNTLVVRTVFNGHKSFIEILDAVKQTTLEAYQHQDIPFEQLIEHLEIKRELNRNAIFQVRFTFQSDKVETSLALEGLQIEFLTFSHATAKFDLLFDIFEHINGVEINIEYATDLFEETTIERLVIHFKELIQHILVDPTQSIDALRLLPIEEERKITNDWNNTRFRYSEDETIHDFFEKQAAESPENIAIVFENHRLTYKKLNERANQLAHYFRKMGIQPGDVIAIAIPKSLEMVIVLLATLKAGAAYVPLDPYYPREGLEFMLSDSGSMLLVSQSKYFPLFDNYPVRQLNVLFDMEDQSLFLVRTMGQEDDLSLQSAENLKLPFSHHHLCYIIYTSGSTGNPKGVMISHRSLVNYTRHIIREIKHDIPLRFAYLSTFSADLGNTSLYVSILTGSELHLLDETYNFDSFMLSSYIAENKIDFIKTIPSHFESLSLALKEQTVLPEKYLFLGGESFQQSVCLKIKNDVAYRNCSAPTRIYNHYGPTEATIGCCIFNLKNYNHFSTLPIPIGRPILNTQIYILDSNLNPVPVGVKGEIYIGGLALARGYLNSPELTAQKFIPNPFSANSDELRLYRSGDIGRYLSDGNIVFLGRSDEQFKIRGFRIEPGAIEAALKTHGDIEQVVVVAKKHEMDNKRLIAYLISGEFTPSEIELREFLQSRLPSYMIPSFFVYVDKFPLLPNGKIDRKGLYQTHQVSYDVSETDIPPQTELEQTLAGIWADVLRVKKVSVHDNFFKMGGDSILSIQLLSKARARGIHLTLKEIINHPTIFKLTKVAKKEKQGLSLILGQNYGTTEVPLTPIQHEFFKNNHSDPNHFNQSIMLLAQKRIEFSILEKAVAALISHHESLRFRFSLLDNGEWKQDVSQESENELICRVVDFSSIEDKLTFKIEQESFDAQKSLDIKQGPLIRVVLFECGQQRLQCLLIVIHHLVVDGISWGILLEDLEQFYCQLAESKTLVFPSESHSYQQWSNLLKRYAYSKDLEQELGYWQKIIMHLKNAPLLTDYKSEILVDLNATDTFNLSLTEEDTIKLLYEVPKTYNTEINDILLTALVLAIGDWSKRYALGFFLEGHGREEIMQGIEISKTVGWFTSIFPVYLYLENPNELLEAIKSIQEQLKEIPNKGIGYGILTYLRENYVKSPTEVSLRFNYLGQWDTTLSTNPLFTFSKEMPGFNISSKNKLPYLLDMLCMVKDQKFQLSLMFSKKHYHPDTIKKIVEYYLARLKAILNHNLQRQTFKINNLITCFPGPKNSPIMFFVHPIGGNINWYQHLAHNLASSFKMYAIESIFLHENQDVQSLEELATLYLENIRSLQECGPFILCGWSFGGTIAYEMARILETTGHKVKVIIIDQNLNIEYSRYQKKLCELERSSTDALKPKEKEQLFCQYKHYQLLLKYKASAKIGEIIAFKSKANFEEVLGWEDYSYHYFEFIIGEDHFSILNEDNSKLLAEKIKETIYEQESVENLTLD
jgi:amino acid adenylation domain-containing protein/non-ribosomal peptide synthase protein (TIGR01720 family)